MMHTIRLLLVDDHQVVRTGLRAFLDGIPGLQVVAEAGTGEEAMRAAFEVRPDVVLMDVTMPGMDGLEATRRLKQAGTDAAILALTVHDDKRVFMAMLAAGADGYLSKQAAPDELVLAIRSVHQGHAYLQPALARLLLEDYQESIRPEQHGAAPGGLDRLSDREKQVLGLVAEGRTNPEIGAALNLSPKTIARHRERIMKKLDLHSRTDLVRFAIRSGLTTPA
jgi:DNA-binding NarL/FixJ family response regulator